MKKLILLPLFLLLLTSCGSSDSSSVAATVPFSWENFTMDIPKSWIAVDKSALPATKNGSIVLALTSTDIVSGFSNNMSIMKEKLTEKMTSKKYSIVNYALTTGEYKDFTKLDEKTLVFTADKDETNLYVFEAKYSDKTSKQKFVQTAKVCNDSVYLITIALGLSSGSTTRYEDLIKTFTCK